jgi:anti-anti-sigma factor
VFILEIKVSKEDGRYLIKPSGFLDTMAAPEFESRINAILAETDETNLNLAIDLDEVVFVGSAGLHVLLAAAKTAKKQQGRIVVLNVKDSIKEIFDMTGFTSFLDIQ